MIAETLVEYFEAIPDRVSPRTTVCVVVEDDGAGVAGAAGAAGAADAVPRTVRTWPG